MSVIVYGIPNCDTVKKARAWLAERGVDHAFHDYKKADVDAAALTRWVDRLGWEALLNRSGTTFRKLDDAAKTGIDREKAIALMLEHPSLISRPLLEDRDTLEVGFKPERYAALFG